MGIWIRSKNKEELVKADRLSVVGKGIESLSPDDSTTLGEYETKERAMEVLDEIQKSLETEWVNHIYDDGQTVEHENRIYQMPEK